MTAALVFGSPPATPLAAGWAWIGQARFIIGDTSQNDRTRIVDDFHAGNMPVRRSFLTRVSGLLVLLHPHMCGFAIALTRPIPNSNPDQPGIGSTRRNLNRMAQQTTVVLTDDIDGSKATETVSFALDGAHYEIDLNAKNAKNLRKSVAEFVDSARKVRAAGAAAGRPTPARQSSRRSADGAAVKADKDELAAIRAWASENGVTVAARGRISESVKAQFAASKTRV